MTHEKGSQSKHEIPWANIAIGAAATTVAAASYMLWNLRARTCDDFILNENWSFLMGNLNDIRLNAYRLHDYRAEFILKHEGEICGYSTFGMPPILYINNGPLIEHVFTKYSTHLCRSVNRDILHPMFGDGIFNANPEGWKKQRKIASRLLTMRNLKFTMFENFRDVSKRMCTKLEGRLGSGGTKVQEDMFDLFNRVTMDGFVTSAFGIESDSIERYPDDSRFSTAFNRGMKLVLERVYIRPWWRIERFFDIGRERLLREDSTYLRDLCDSVAKENRERKAKSEINKRCDLLSLFIESYPEASDALIQDICLNFIIAGRDTTGTLLSWCVYRLAKHPEIAEKVRRECDAIDDLTYENVAEMKYTESVLLETLRMHPSVPASNTQYVRKEVPLPDGRVIPKGVRVGINNYALGRAPWMYDDPLEFRPSRFQNGVKSFEPAHFPAFSVNPRLCLGRGVALMEAKVCLWYFLRSFEFELVDPDEDITYEMNIILIMKGGLKLYLKKRDV